MERAQLIRVHGNATMVFFGMGVCVCPAEVRRVPLVRMLRVDAQPHLMWCVPHALVECIALLVYLKG